MVTTACLAKGKRLVGGRLGRRKRAVSEGLAAGQGNHAAELK
jgi:hypothetical protein